MKLILDEKFNEQDLNLDEIVKKPRILGSFISNVDLWFGTSNDTLTLYVKFEIKIATSRHKKDFSNKSYVIYEPT